MVGRAATGLERTGIEPSTERIDKGPETFYTYRGVLRDGPRMIIWRCEHEHPHRDIGWQSALHCAGKEYGRRKDAGEDLSGTWRPRVRVSRSIIWEQDPDLPF